MSPKAKEGKDSKVMSLDHTVRCGKLQHGQQEAYRCHQGGNCDLQGNHFMEVVRTKARLSPDGEEKKQRHSAPPTLRRNYFFRNRGRNFSGGPVVRCLLCSAADASLVPGQGTGIPPATGKRRACEPQPENPCTAGVNDPTWHHKDPVCHSCDPTQPSNCKEKKRGKADVK